MPKVNITDTTLRDAHQCLLATRMRTEDMLPICEKLDQVGFHSLEVWGGATFDACIRFLKEDPWERLRQLKQALPNTKLQMLLRGQNLLGYRNYADDVVTAFIEKSAANGVDIFRIFDALNDLRNLETSIKAVKKMGKHAQGTICYTTSPVHNIEQFVELAKQLETMGSDSIAIKDMAGLLTPQVASKLVKELKKVINIPIQTHTHDTSGLASMCLQKVVDAGCLHIDTAISSMAGGASQTNTESLVVALQNTKYDTGLDLELLSEIAEYFHQVRKKYHQFESDATRVDPKVQLYQVPGGMISNLYNQLKQQNALDKLEAVHAEIPKVREDLGYPPLVTPTSQVVGTQAVLNVLTGERYKTITNEVKLYLQGKYGKAPGEINPDVRKKAIGKAEVIDCRPADLIPNEMTKLKKEIGKLATSEEDILIYAMFPDIGKEYLEQRTQGTLVPESLEPINTQREGPAPHNFKVMLHGESYEIKITGAGQATQQVRPFYVTVDGHPEEVLIEDVDIVPTPEAAALSRPKASAPGHVSVSMPSTVVSVLVTLEDEVNAGTPLLVTEAMKMETEVQAPIAGRITAIHVMKGDSVVPGEALIEISS